jgi:hypothetical protein
MTITLPEPVSAPELEDKPPDRGGCHLSYDGAISLCGMSCDWTNAILAGGSASSSDPCVCGLRRCPACKEIWSR